MKKLILSILLLSLCYPITFSKIYDGDPSEENWGLSVQQTEDGGYIIAGSQLIKTDSFGSEEWRKSYPCFSVQQTSDLGYIVRLISDDGELMLGKLDGLGNTCDYSNGDCFEDNTKWVKTFDGGGMFYGDAIKQTDDNGYIIGIIEEDNYKLMKIDENGAVEWTELLCQNISPNAEVFNWINITTDGGYIAICTTDITPDNQNDYSRITSLIKLDSEHQEDWRREFYEITAVSVQQTNDLGYIILSDGIVIKTNSLGSTCDYDDNFACNESESEWTNYYRLEGQQEHAGQNEDNLYTMQSLSDGSYITGGSTQSNPNNNSYNCWLVHFNSIGFVDWHRSYGGYELDKIFSVNEVDDGGFIMVGRSESFGANEHSSIWLIKTDETGLTCDYTVDGVCLDNTIYGCIYPVACNYDASATTDDGSCLFSEEGVDCDGNQLSLFDALIPEDFSIHSIYPNPFNPVTNIVYGLPEHVNVQILVYDLSGKQVETLINEFQTPGYHSVNWNANNLPSGVYLIRMDSGDFTQTQKVLLVK